jgi:phosphatidylglycerophosphate synthase
MNPKENIFRTKFRKPIDDLIVKIPFPRINPDYISYSTLITTIISVYFFKKNNLGLFCLFLGLTLLLDWMDGTIARKYHLESKKGWILDKTIDRISEIILFTFIWPLGLIFVPLEILIMYLSYNRKFPIFLMFIPPLRLVLLLIYLVILILY